MPTIASSTRPSAASEATVPKSFTATDLLNAGRQRPSRPAGPTEQPDGSAPRHLEDPSTRPPESPETQHLVDLTTSDLGDGAPSSRVVSTSSDQDDKAPRSLEDQTSKLLGDSATSGLDGGAAEPAGAGATYQRVTVFLTSEQRRWIKDTARRLPVDGLSASDLVRLAVTQLHQRVDDGLPLLEALTAQAHQEAASHPGRKNRGLPPAPEP